jgi:hypothetical protein
MDYEVIKKEKFSGLYDLLFSTCETKISPQGSIRINSEKVDHKNFSNWFLGLCKEPQFKDYSELLISAPTPNVFFEDFRRGLKSHQVNMKYANTRGVDVIKDFSYDNFIPFISIEDANKKMFFNKITGEICELDYKTYEITVDKDFRRPPIRAIIDFNPYRPENIFRAESKYGQECTHINTYKCPEWQLSRELTIAEREKYKNVPSIIDSFMRHLFPDDDCRNYVYDWLHHALTKRCETYLVLNGAKGIGKGIFTDHICKALIGKNNHKLAPPGGLESNFNSILENCRMIIFDEFKIDDDEKINKLKRYINTDQMIEHKGQDVSKTITTYNSFIISSNSLSDIKIAWDDRRFSVVDISETKLDEKWSKDDIKELIESINEEDSNIMRDFGYWLLYRKPEGNEFAAYKGSHFYKLCYSSLPEWSRLVIDEVTSGVYEVLDDVTLRLCYKDRNPLGRFPQVHKVEDFLKNYKHEGKYYLGDVIKEGKSYHINVSKHFYKSAQDNTGIQWEGLL